MATTGYSSSLTYTLCFKQTSGLTNHQLTSEKPLKYSHFDLGDGVGKLPGPTTGSTVVALAMHLLQ